MRFKVKRNFFERIAGRVIPADTFLTYASVRLISVQDRLDSCLGDAKLVAKNKNFIGRARERYEKNERSFFYRFASRDVQRDYDMVWHAVGILIKEGQSMGVINREISFS